MAHQKGTIKLEGRIGDLTFYKSKNKYFARQATASGPGSQPGNPKSARSNENAQEFGCASRSAKSLRLLLRRTMKELHPLFYDGTVVNRLTRRMSRIVKADTIHQRGERIILSRNLPLLEGFSLNETVALKDIFFARYRIYYDEVQGMLCVTIPEFLPEAVLDIPPDATLFQFHVIAMTFDPESDQQHAAVSNMLMQGATGVKPSQDIHLSLPTTNYPVFCWFGVSFYKKVGAFPIPLLEPSRNAMDLVHVFLPSASDEGYDSFQGNR